MAQYNRNLKKVYLLLLLPQLLGPLGHGPHLLGEGRGFASQARVLVVRTVGVLLVAGPLDLTLPRSLLLPGRCVERAGIRLVAEVAVVLHLKHFKALGAIEQNLPH